MIRKVRMEEIPLLYPFVYRILSDMELPILEELEGDLLEQIILDAMHTPRYRYGYENAWVCERENQIAGVFFGYPGRWEPLIDGPLRAAMLKYDVPMEEIMTENETLPGQWYLDTLVTAPPFRRQGVALEMLAGAEKIAQEENFRVISLNCDIQNNAGYQLYKKAGFVEQTRIVLNDRIYYHMTKEI